MSHVYHRMLVVTTQSHDPESGVDIVAAREKAIEILTRRGDEVGSPLGRLVTPIFMGVVNHTRTFYINTCGSNEGWDDLEYHNIACREFVEWLKTKAHSDGSCGLKWAWVQYGDDGGRTYVLDSRDDEYNRVRFNAPG